jgi:hypothetical protein
MSPELTQFLLSNYRRSILRESVPLVTPLMTPRTMSRAAAPHVGSDLIDEIKDEITRIDSLKLGANLATRDFVSYVNRSALVDLLETLEVAGTFALVEARDTAHLTVSVPTGGALNVTEARDRAGFTGVVT